MPVDTDLSLMDPILERHRGEKDALIAMLQEMQELYGYLPEQALLRLSRETRVPASQIYGVATFYAQFHLTPRGRNTVRICRGTACHVQGCNSVVTAAKDVLGVDVGETTDDRQFSLETVACLGTCFLAPVMMVNQDYHGKLDQHKTETILKEAKHSAERSIDGQAE